MKKIFLGIVSLLIASPVFIANAEAQMPLRAVQGGGVINPLSMSTRAVWPDNIETVGDAVQYILEPTEYRLAIDFPADPESLPFSKKPIPPVAKINRTIPIVDLIQILIGVDNSVVIDINHKLVSFKKGH